MVFHPNKSGLITNNSRSPIDGKTFAKKQVLVCSRMPDVNTKFSYLDYHGEHLSVSARLQKSYHKKICQDSALVFAVPGLVAVGVFDGHEMQGELVSSFMADLVIERLADTKDDSPSEALLHASSRLAERYRRATAFDPANCTGGTTAMLVFLYPDGRFEASSVADSALYQCNHATARRFFNYDQIPVRGQKALMPVRGMKLAAFRAYRNIIRSYVGIANQFAMETASGILAVGEKLVVASDGLTKNLRIFIDEDSKRITDASGCDDIFGIILNSDSSPADALLHAVNARISLTAYLSDTKLIGKTTAILPVDDDISIISVTRNK